MAETPPARETPLITFMFHGPHAAWLTYLFLRANGQAR